jgi:hypothetical protein
MQLVTWNVHHQKSCVTTALQYGDAHGINVIIIQEPPILNNGDIPGTASGRYYKLWAGTGRVAAYINKRIPLSTWDYEAYPDLIHITFHWRQPLHVYGVYSPGLYPGANWHTPLNSHLLANPPPPLYHDVILMGDLNLHHP